MGNALARTDIGCSGSILRKIRWSFTKYQSMGEAAYVASATRGDGLIRQNPSIFARITLERVLLFWAGNTAQRS